MCRSWKRRLAVRAVLPALLIAALPSAAATPVGTAAANADGADAGPVFREVAQEAGLDFFHFNGMIGRLYFHEVLSGGAALFDYDNDGDLDLYLGQGTPFGDDRVEQAVFKPRYPLPLTDRLYRNDLATGEDGTRVLRFTDVTEESGLRALGNNMGAAAGDYDNDGWVDLYVTNLGSNHLLRNNGDGTFTDVIRESRADDRRWSAAASFFDYDRDGWLDLFVGNYTEFRPLLHKDCTASTGAREYCGPLSYPALKNRLFRNRGDGTFENVTSRALIDNPVGSTLGTVTADFNDDGWLDLFVANDLLHNHMWINQQDGTFINDALLAGTAVDAKGQPQASMGVVAGDLNGDGHEDLFMTHLRMEMNTLYVNDGTGLFTDVSGDSGLGRSSFKYTGFGTALFDYDNDGVMDLYVANGAVTRIESQLRAGDKHPVHETNLLFRGLGSGRFEEIAPMGRIDRVYSEVSRSVAAGDLDNDGDTDLVVSNNAGAARLLLNQVGQQQPWVGLRLILEDFPRDALGARIALRRRNKPTLWRRLKTDGSYVAANDPRVLIGLGRGEPAIESLRVRWPDGTIEEFAPEAVAVGIYTTLQQGSGKPVDDL